MSKNKKHKNTQQYQNNTVNIDIVADETATEQVEVINEEINLANEIVDENDTVTTDVTENLTETVGVSEESTVTPEIDEPKTLVVERLVVNFYKVGTDYINNKCVNQIISTSDLANAKEECIRARDKFKKSYYVFDKDGNAIYTAEYKIPKDNFYRVGTEWKNGVCINQKYYCVNLDEACKVANENTKLTGVIHNVYDPTGKLVFSSKKKLTLLSNKKRKVIENADWYLK